MQSNGSEVGYNKGFAAAYELGWSDFSRKAAETILPFFAENTPKNTERLALDLACGTGTFARALVAAGFKVTGVDKSQPMLDLARKASSDLGEEGGRVEYVCADMSELPSLSKRFSLITCLYDSVNHLEDLDSVERTLTAARNQASNDAILIFDVNTQLGLQQWASDLLTGEGFQLETAPFSDGEAVTLQVKGTVDTEGEHVAVETSISERAFAVSALLEVTRRSGWHTAVAGRARQLGVPVNDPENESRTFITAFS